MKLLQYLERLWLLRQSLQSHQRFIIGNGSGDFDSIFGSLIYGYMKLLFFNQLYIPLIDVKKQDIPLRFDVMQVLKLNGINHETLFYSSQVPNLNQKQEVLLYDHNYRLGIKPRQIIDHHDLTDKQCKQKIVTTCGSGLTLLYYLLHPEDLSGCHDTNWVPIFSAFGMPQSYTHTHFDINVDRIIRMGILLDSSNFKPQEKNIKWVDQDRQAVQNIEKRLSSDKLIDFQTLSDWKFDEQLNLSLTMDQLMIKDFKLFQYGKYRVGYSVFMVNPKSIFNKFGQEYINHFEQTLMQDKKYDCHFFLFNYSENHKFRKQGIIWTYDQQFLQRLATIIHDLKFEVVQNIKLPNGLLKQHWVDPTNSTSRKIIDKVLRNRLG